MNEDAFGNERHTRYRLWMMGNFPIQKNPTLRQLTEFLDEIDATHVLQAIENEIGFFITTDRSTILKHSDRLEAEFKVKARRPSEMLAILTKE